MALTKIKDNNPRRENPIILNIFLILWSCLNCFPSLLAYFNIKIGKILNN